MSYMKVFPPSKNSSTVGFDKPAICVDVHVHRICNRLGYVKTASKQMKMTQSPFPRKSLANWME